MLPTSVKRTNAGVGAGVVLQLTGFALSGSAEPLVSLAGSLLVLGSLPVFVWGCMHYAEGKGHNKWVGLVGLAGCIGLMVLIVLPDQAKDPASLFTRATQLEARGEIGAALALYETIRKGFPETQEAKDSQASIDAIRARQLARTSEPSQDRSS